LSEINISKGDKRNEKEGYDFYCLYIAGNQYAADICIFGKQQ
jgi:hypothetical protein